MNVNAISSVSSLSNFTSSRANSAKVGEVNSDGQKLRSEAKLTGEVISKLDKGSTVNVLSTENGWARVSYKGKIGYLALDYLKLTT